MKDPEELTSLYVTPQGELVEINVFNEFMAIDGVMYYEIIDEIYFNYIIER
ncbi:MAG: hypothetical protein ACK40G_03280 [Cytophagaceae bacterium]